MKFLALIAAALAVGVSSEDKAAAFATPELLNLDQAPAEQEDAQVDPYSAGEQLAQTDAGAQRYWYTRYKRRHYGRTLAYSKISAFRYTYKNKYVRRTKFRRYNRYYHRYLRRTYRRVKYYRRYARYHRYRRTYRRYRSYRRYHYRR